MADTRVKIVDIQVRYQQAVEGMAKYRAAIAEVKKYQKDLKKELADGKIAREDYDRSMAASDVLIRQQGEILRTLTKQVNNQVKAQQEEEGSLKQLRAELSNATTAYDAMSRAERLSAAGRELRDKINGITTELKAAEEETQRFYRNVGNYKSATEGLEAVRVKIADVGKQLLSLIGIGSAMQFSKQVMEVTRNFEDGMARVRAVTNASAEEMKMMTEEAREMGRTTIYHATDAAQAMENLTRGGFTASEATAALSRTLQLAQANTISLDQASDIMIRTMRGFELPIEPEEMEHANDVLSKTASTSSTNVLELAEALKNAAPFGHALNQSVEEVNAALGVLADVGIRGADAGTALRMVILGLSSPTAKQQKVFKEYGIEINQASLESEGLTKTLQRLKASGIMEASNSAELLSAVFGRKCTPNVMALVGNIDRLGEKLATLTDAQGTTERMFDQSYSKMSKAVFSLESAWESFKISLGESNNQMFVGPLQALTSFVRFLETNVDKVVNLIVSAIASIGIMKMVSQAKRAFVTIKESAIVNAEEASTTVRTLQSQELTLRKTIASQTVALEKATGTERTMLEAKVLANKRELAATEKALVKAKTAEVEAWEKAAAVNSANSWKSAMAAAGAAVKSFVTVAKTTLKSFGITAAITLAIDGIMTLVQWIKKTADETSGLSREMKLMSDANKKASESCAEQISKLRLLYDATQDQTLSEEERIENIKELKREYPEYFQDLSTEAILAGKAAEKYDALADSILRAAKARTYEDKITEIVKQNIDYQAVVDENQSWMDDNQARYDRAKASLEAATKYVEAATSSVSGFEESAMAMRGAAATKDKIIDEYATHQKKVEDNLRLIEENNKTIKYFEEQIKKMNSPEGSSGSDGGSGNGENNAPKTTYKEDVEKAKKDWDEAEAELKKLIDSQTATTQEVNDARKDVEEAKKKYEDLVGSTIKGGSGGKSDNENDKTIKKQAELERKAFEEAEQAMLDLLKDTAAKRRAQLEKQYDDEIRKLKVRLATEKNLTETAKEAIRQTIIAKEQKKNEELAKLDEEELKRDIENRQKLIASRLEIAKKGSEYEMNLKKQQNEEKLKLDEMALQKEQEIAMEDARQRVAIAVEAYGAESQAASDARLRLLEIEADYEDRLMNMQEAARQRNLELEEQYQQQLIANRQQAFQNQIMELDIQNQERLLKEQEDSDLYLNQELGNQMLHLQVVTQGEMDILAVRQQAAEQKYNDIVAAGQLESETTEAYNARVLAAEKAKVDAKAAYRKAELTNDKAYLQAERALTNSLVSLTSVLGESNEEFAMLSKIITLFQITVDTGRALSAGIASASALPFPANLAAIATTVATVLANVATAISTVKSAKFAEGGKVNGPGTGTSDSIPARLSNGEFVMTAKATNMFEPLLAAMNAIGAGVVPLAVSNGYREAPLYADELRDSFTESFKEAASNIHPVVSVVEITEAQRQVEVIETLDNL